MDVLKYKNYVGSIEFSDEDNCYVGQVMGMRSCIAYEGETIDELRTDFETAIDDYLRLCKNYNHVPELPKIESEPKKSFFSQLGKSVAAAML